MPKNTSESGILTTSHHFLRYTFGGAALLAELVLAGFGCASIGAATKADHPNVTLVVVNGGKTATC